MRSRLGIWSAIGLALLVMTACSKARSENPAGPPEAGIPPADPPPPSSVVVHVDGPRGGLDAALAEHAARAATLHLTPYLEFSADWCPPCRAFKHYLDDPMMQDALAGTYLVIADFDVFSDEATDMGVIGIPTWIGLDAAGKSTRRAISSGVWEEDIPANMAPPLKAFFHP